MLPTLISTWRGVAVADAVKICLALRAASNALIVTSEQNQRLNRRDERPRFFGCVSNFAERRERLLVKFRALLFSPRI